MQVNFAHRFRIYPSEEQKILLAKHFGSCRFVWNYFLNERKEFYLKNKEEIEAKRIKGGLNYYDNARELTQLKQKDKDIEYSIESLNDSTSEKDEGQAIDDAFNFYSNGPEN